MLHMYSVFSQGFIRDTFGHDDPKEETLGDAIEVVLGLSELWDPVPDCIPTNLMSPKLINEIRRGLENTLIHFCSIGETKMSSTNRKMTQRRDCQSHLQTAYREYLRS